MFDKIIVSLYYCYIVISWYRYVVVLLYRCTIIPLYPTDVTQLTLHHNLLFFIPHLSCPLIVGTLTDFMLVLFIFFIFKHPWLCQDILKIAQYFQGPGIIEKYQNYTVYLHISWLLYVRKTRTPSCQSENKFLEGAPAPPIMKIWVLKIVNY